ncbi:MAG: M14 family zinc carboxypeptidase [Pseudomonadota bacterium]
MKLLKQKFIDCLKPVSFILASSSLVIASAFSEEITNLEEAYERLSTYEEIKQELKKIKKNALRPMQIGPLIRNGYNRGLINIDRPLNNVPDSVNKNVCGDSNPYPSAREAVICTIEKEGRGNKDPQKIGFSNYGRELIAVRMGNPYGPKVMVITQQHGNEPAGTEAALNIIKAYSKKRYGNFRSPINNLNMLFIVRANPDGGEPSPECTNILPVAQPFFGSCAFSRNNLDPSAGGGFLANTEEGFAGVVGHGYNLNRYHYTNLDDAIRPVETQAMVAAALSFKPDYVLDLHGDAKKTDCELDLSTLIPNVFGALPSVKCIPSDNSESEERHFSIFADAELSSPEGIETRALGASIMKKIERVTKGSVGRFSQLQLGSGVLNDGSASAYQNLGAVSSGWETSNFGFAFRPDVTSFIDGVPNIAPNNFLIDPLSLEEQIRLNTVALRRALFTISKFIYWPPQSQNGFCDFPLATGNIGSLPTDLWGADGVDEPTTIPLVPALGIPVAISGVCPGDG